MPPMPVTFFMPGLFCFEIIVLNANPERKDAVTTKTINDTLFILLKFTIYDFLFKMSELTRVTTRPTGKISA